MTDSLPSASSGRPSEVVYISRNSEEDRRYVLHRPGLIQGPGSGALVIALDGRGGTPWTAMKITGWNALSDREGFAVIYPEAQRLDPTLPMHYLTNPQMWCAGGIGSDQERDPVDDVSFLRDVVADAVRRIGQIEAKRIFMAGFSNGAAMTFRMAASFPGLFAAIGVAGGHVPSPLPETGNPVPTCYLFGDADPICPFNGGRVKLPWGVEENRPSVRNSLNRWLTWQGITGEPSVEETEHARIETYRERNQFIVVKNHGHVWPGGKRLLPTAIVGQTSDRVNATEACWKLFSSVVA